MKSIYAISGRKRSGKDSLMMYIKSKGNYKHMFNLKWLSHNPKLVVGTSIPSTDNPRRFAFADKLKKLTYERYPYVADMKDKEEQRPFFIKVAKDECRDKGKNVWCTEFLPMLDLNDDVIVTDLRFKHEDEYLRSQSEKHGWRYIKIRIVDESPHGGDVSETEHLDIEADCFASRC